MSYDILFFVFLRICFNAFIFLHGFNETCCGIISVVGIMLHQRCFIKLIQYLFEESQESDAVVCCYRSHLSLIETTHYSSTCSLQRGDGPSSALLIALSIINL